MAEENKNLPQKTDVPEGNSHKIKENKAPVRVHRDIREVKADDGFIKKADDFFRPIVEDVILPSAKDTFIDIVNEIMSGIANGIVEAVTGQPSNIRSNVRVRHTNGHTDYNAVSRNRNRYSEVRSGTIQTNVSETKRIKELTVASRQDAISVIEQLRSLIDEYGHVTINEMYGLEEIGLSCPYTYQNFGWYDLNDAGIIKNPDGSYSFDLPKAVKIDH